MPTTSWLARNVTLSTACANARSRAAATPQARPTAGRPVAHEPSAPAKVAVSIMPSRLMLRTPARSLTSSPVPARMSGIESRRDEPKKTAICSSVIPAPS